MADLHQRPLSTHWDVSEDDVKAAKLMFLFPEEWVFTFWTPCKGTSGNLQSLRRFLKVKRYSINQNIHLYMPQGDKIAINSKDICLYW